jgi:hypothetical protein
MEPDKTNDNSNPIIRMFPFVTVKNLMIYLTKKKKGVNKGASINYVTR